MMVLMPLLIMKMVCADAGNDGDADFADDSTEADAGVSSNDFSCFC